MSPPVEGAPARWRDYLAGVGTLDLPTDRLRPATPSGAVVRAVAEYDPSWTADLCVAPPVGWLAAYAVVLARCGGASDFAIGVPDAAVRCAYDGAVPFGEWVARVGSWLDSATALGRLPDAESPPYRVFFAEAEGADEPAAPGTTRSTPDVELIVAPGVLRLVGAADLFDVDGVAALLDRVVRVASAGAGAPETPVSRLPLLAEPERERVLVAWNRNTAPYPADQCLHELVERVVTATPEVVAVRCGGRSLTYRQLNDRANRLAVRLRALGVRPEHRVGLLSHRSVDSVVAFLAILKAGGAYVPLDPAHPAPRLHHIAADAGVALVTGPAGDAGVVPATRFVPVPDTDTGTGTANPPNVATPDNLAYVIYTSGSTGMPKGVAVSHRQLVASTAARWAYPDPGTDLLTFPLTFDAAAGGLHWMLTKGGTCLMPTETELHDPRLMARLVREHRITHLNTIHSQYRLILEETEPADLADLVYVDVGGEALPPDLVGTHYRRTPGAVLCNCYGPTEATVWAAVCDCRPAHAFGTSVPIGGPIRNVRLYVLDEFLAPVPVGVAGELFIGGDTVARGYVNQPGLTAARFVPDPFGGTDGGRLYRTEDRVRWLPDGQVEFLGRVDHQVKIRGFRVELAEIESVLMRHPDVTGAAVTVDEPAPGHKRIVAHVTGADAATVRRLAGEQLPEYMRPDRVVVLDALPRTPAGKVDRVRLTEPARPAEADTATPLSDAQVEQLLRDMLG